MADKVDRPNFDDWYRDERSVDGLPALTPWDIGGPQPVVQQLVAYGAVRGEVLDPGTGPGHNAIYYAAKGYATTGIDSSPAAIERAKANAERAGVSVNFEVADATKLEGLENRFDTVIDSAFYHVFFEDEETQQQYLQALRRATKPGARLFMFEFGRHNVNGLVWEGLPADNFERLLPASGWRLDHLGTTAYQGHFSPEAVAVMSSEASPELAERMKVVWQRLAVIGPALTREPSGAFAVLGGGGHPPRLAVTRGCEDGRPNSLCGRPNKLGESRRRVRHPQFSTLQVSCTRNPSNVDGEAFADRVGRFGPGEGF